MPTPPLATNRLKLRHWRDEDREPFAALNADPRVMQHFAGTRDRGQSDKMVDRMMQLMSEQAFGLWAVEAPGLADFIGFVGLMIPSFEAHFTSCVEIGWRLAHEHWGRGYASEAAGVALSYAFDVLKLAEVVSFTIPANERSIAVMKRLGMTRSPEDDFAHPAYPEDHPIGPHVLFRLRREDWRQLQ